MASSEGVDARARRQVVLLLRAGLVAGSLLMGLGLVLAVFEGRLRSHEVAIDDLIRSMVSGRPSGLMAGGVLLLVLAPFARVVVLAVEFLREGIEGLPWSRSLWRRSWPSAF